MTLKKVISGGQTGVDRAGLDAAMGAGIPVSGFCPRDRKAEDGRIPDIYPLQELASPEYCVRTEKNVIESDGTLIINKGPLTDGTRRTFEYTVQHGKTCLVVHLDAQQVTEPAGVARWIREQRIFTLNIAGPRESKYPEGIYREVRAYLEKVFAALKNEF